MAIEQKKGFNIQEHIYNFGVVFVLILLCIIMTIATPRFLTLDNLRNVGAQAVVNSIVSIGMFLAILTAGIDLSVGSVLALSTMVMGFCVRSFNLHPIFAMILCLGVGALLGLANGLMLTKLRLPHPFISTLGMKQMARGLALVVTVSQPISGFAARHKIWAAYTGNITEISIGLVVLLYVFMYFFLTRTATGRYVYAVGGNKEASRLSGINVDGVLNLVYMISGGMAALAGLVLVGRTDSAYPLAGTDYETDAIAAVIIGGASFFGGIGRIGNTIVGVLLIAVLRNGLNLLRVDANLQVFAIGAVIVLAVWVDVIRQRTMKKS